MTGGSLEVAAGDAGAAGDRGARPSLVARLFSPVRRDGREYPAPGLVVLAIVGASFLVVAAAAYWFAPTDEAAYWRGAERLLAGLPLYDPTARPDLAYAYWYPPPLAQVLAPFTPFVSETVFTAAWTALLLGCLWWLGGRNLLVALALVAFLPVAVEFRTRNVHLVLAVLIVLALRRSWLFWIPAAAIKISPVLGVLYLATARRYREAALTAGVGLAVIAVSFVISPAAWSGFADVVTARAGSQGGSFIPVPYPVRFLLGAALAGVGGRLGGRRGEIALVVGITLANPTLWGTALSLLIAIVPLVRTPLPRPRQLVPAPEPQPATT